MHIQRIDPRDTLWEVDDPTYRVCFWTQLPVIDPDAARGWQSEEFEIRHADVKEVIEWGRARGHEQRADTFTLHLVAECNGDLGMFNLAGVEPPRTDIDWQDHPSPL